MRLYFAFLLFIFYSNLFSQTNIAYRGAYSFPNNELANLWGYADANGNEYALVGTQKGMSIINVTVPTNPTLVVNISGPFSDWREIKTYGHYAYVVTEGTTGPKKGLTIIDLSQLPNIDTNNINHVRTYRGDGAINNLFNKAHALHVDETAGFLYLFGSNLYNGRPLILNLNPNPLSPTYAGYVNTTFAVTNHNYVHDGYADNNMLYAGHIYGGFFSIVNTANKSNPVLIETQNTPNSFTHNTWLNGNVVFTTDETDNSFVAAYDVSDPENIRFLDKIQSNPGSNSIVHNTYIINNFAVTSWYKDGFTIVDGTRPDNLVQVGDYDTYPGGSGSGFFGCWGVYPYLPSGNIIASNINDVPNSGTGKLFVLTPTYVRACYLEGMITDAISGNPVNGAEIQIVSSPTQIENSGSDGAYKMGRLTGGTYTVKVTKTGYQVFTTSASLSNGVLTILNVALQPLVLPVELTRFDARAEGNTALLEWETASEYNNTGFEIQHSINGTVWVNIGFVPARGDRSSPTTYSFRVGDLAPGTHFFRLRQVDLDGSSHYSGVRSISVEGQKLQATLLPTVVSDYCTLKINSPISSSVRVEIVRADGQSTGQIWNLQVENEQVLNLFSLDLPAGFYFVLLQSEQEKIALPFVVK
jgi:choice-of-anchor B domain-containing protein